MAIPPVVYTAHRWVVGGVVMRLEGLLTNADDALFEMAARGNEAFDQRRCFDLARQLRIQRAQLLGGYRHVLERGSRTWATREFQGPEVDGSWEHAQLLGARARVNFGPLLGVLAAEFASLLECDVPNFEALPISPTWVANSYLESRRAAGLGANPFLDRLFVRYVIDRLGGLYGEVREMLVNSRSNDTGGCEESSVQGNPQIGHAFAV